jgi:four helix bundle protein
MVESDMYSQALPKAAPQVFRTFEDLEVYRLAREFRKAIYEVTRKVPTHEKFELASQMRRAAVSLTNNIAEGHGRYHFLDQIKFQLQARGSLTELIDDLNICSDEKYLPADEVAELKKAGHSRPSTGQRLHPLSARTENRSWPDAARIICRRRSF